jgi:O-antigen/teichoic acid export membrane protein
LLAHLCSLALTAALCVPLLGRYYSLRRIVTAPIPLDLAANLLGSGLSLLPTNLVRRMLIDAPPVVLNLLLPGARGAAAAGLFEIARRISTVTYFVRQAFQYVLAPLSSAQAHMDRAAIAPLFGFASRVSTALVVPVGGLLIFAGKDILSVYRDEALAALPLLYVLVLARTAEAIVGPANTIVEMIGHRALPILNSAIGATSWVVLAVLLTPIWGAFGMAVAVGLAIVASSYAATIELRLSDGLSPFDRKFLQGFALALVGVGLMAGVEWLSSGPVRFASLLILWLGTSWATMRYGLTREDREALGPVSRRLRLVR